VFAADADLWELDGHGDGCEWMAAARLGGQEAIASGEARESSIICCSARCCRC